MQMFQGFKPEGMKKIQQRMGYTGPADQFQSYLQANPDKQMMMNSYVNKAMNMASGGYVRNFQAGGFNLPEGFNPQSYAKANPDVQAAIDAGQFTSAADHYQKFGGGEDRKGVTGFTPPAEFDATSYIDPANNPDLAQNFEERQQADPTLTAQQYAVEHFTNYGGAENRPGVPAPDPAGTQPPAEDNVGAGDQTVSQGPLPSWLTPPPEGSVNTQAFVTHTNPLTGETYTTATGGYSVNVGGETDQSTGTNIGQLAGDLITGGGGTVDGTTNTGQTVGELAGDLITGGGGTAGTSQPDPNRTFATLQELASTPNESLTPDQQHIRNFYSSTPEQQEAINAMPAFRNAQLPVGEYQPGVRILATSATPQGALVDGGVYLANRPDIIDAINAGNTFGLDPASLEGLTEQEKNQKLAQAHYDSFGNSHRINPLTGLSLIATNFDDASDEVIMDYLDQFPDLRAAGIDTLAEARSHYAQFGRDEIASGARPPLVIFDLTPQQLEAFRYSNPAYQNMTPKELRTTYIAIGGATGATNFDRNAQILNAEQLQIYRDNNPDLANLSDYDLTAHFIQFGRQEMLQNKRPKIDALVPPISPYAGLTSIGDISAARMERPTLVGDTKLTAQGIPITQGTDVATTTGQVAGDRTATTTTATTPTGATATPQGTVAQVASTTGTATGVQGVTDATTGRTMSLTKAKPDAAQQTTSAVTGQTAETGTGIAIDPSTQVQRAGITTAETVAPVAEASEAAKFVEQIVAQSANPTASATVAGQLSNLLTDFDASNPPSWAAGAMRAATAEMARRGLGSSSLAGQAIVQAAMESALPIAQADAQIQAQFEGQNLSNKQQMAMFYAQQRASFMGQEFDQGFQARVMNAAKVSDIADKNFNAQQQVQLENSNIVNTMNLNNLSNRQAVQMAEIASLAQLDIANLNNRQQAAVQEAQAFLQKDLTDVSNDQQTTLFNAQQRIQSMFTDAAADNARKQFNASSDNQSNQFFANLATQTSQFNDAQKNAINQFNAGQENTISRFNSELNNQRDQFNAQNRLVIDQSNAQWRRSIATADTAATNRANELNAEALLDISNTAYNDLWQYYADTMEFAWTSAENERTRTINLAIEQLRNDSNVNIAELKNDFASSVGFGNLIGTFLTAPSSSAAGGFLSSFGSSASSAVETGLEFLAGFS